jgi:ATP-dependent helicase/nuclease subunit B
MRVLAHADPFVLETEMLDRVAAAKAEDPLAPLLVVVPTARLVAHVRRRIAERTGACLGVHVLHHRALALSILDGIVGSPHRVASRPLLLAILSRVLDRIHDNPLARFVRARPGAAKALLGTLRDLRDAGVESRELGAAVRGSGEEALAQVYEAYSAGLASLAAAGLADDAALARAATGAASAFAKRFAAIVHHGAYELIGVHLDLVRALDLGRGVVFLSPIEPGARVSEYAERFAERHLLSPGEKVERLEHRAGGLLGERLGALYDEAAQPGPLPAGRVRLRHAQGARTEIETAVRHALSSVAAGVAPDGIAIVARSLGPYAAAVEEILDDGGLAHTSSLAVPLRRDPFVRDLLTLLRAVADAFPRQRTAEILASPRLRWEAFGIDVPPPGDVAEAWSRQAGIVGGVEEWTTWLADWAGRPRHDESATAEERSAAERGARGRFAQARRIGDAVVALSERCRAARALDWAAHADEVERLARDAFVSGGDGRPEEPIGAFAGLLAEMRALKEVLGDGRPVPFAEMVAWLEEAVGDATLSPRRSDDGGLRVLDAMQARGLTFERVLLVGMNSGAFPRVAREDPFLSDGTRAGLSETIGRPVPVKRDGAAEERLLLALVLGSARNGLDVSWQRADDSGRTRTASIALREIGRIALGSADLDRVRDSADGVPAHPRFRLEHLARDPGLLSPDEETLLVALRGRRSEAAAAALAGRDAGALARGVLMLQSTESFDPACTTYDARVGAGRVALDRVAVTALEQLGRCPLQFFFRHVLKVYELEEPASAFEIAEWDLGERVHALLESLYARLRDEELFGTGRAGDLVSRAEAVLPDEWDRAVGETGARFAERLPVLWGIERERWLAALLAFVREDLARLATEGWSPRSFEETRRAPVDLDEGVVLEIEGRLDRTFRRDGGILVGDYKTSGDLEERASETAMLKGTTLQVPLYAAVARGASVELLGVGPEHAPGTGRRAEHRRVVFPGFSRPEVEAGFRETARVLVRLARSGRFPLRKGRHCSWCPYAGACRRNDPPTAHREEHAPDTRDFRDLAEKNRRDRPTLERVRAAGLEAGEAEP